MSKKIKVFCEKYLTQTKTPTGLNRCSLAETIFLVFKLFFPK